MALIFVPRMGVAKKALGNYSDARKYLERALRIDPTNADVIRQMVMHNMGSLQLCAEALAQCGFIITVCRSIFRNIL
jgi:hypothetical protein